MDQETNTQKSFKDFFSVIESYAAALKKTFTSNIPLQSWFQGDVNGEEATEMLAGKPPGTFLIRFSSQPGFYAASYVDREGRVRHTLVEPTGEAGFKLHGEPRVFNSMSELIAVYEPVLTYPLQQSENDLCFQKIKDLIKKNYDPQVTLQLDVLEEELRKKAEADRNAAEEEKKKAEEEKKEGEAEPVRVESMDTIHTQLDSLITDMEATAVVASPPPTSKSPVSKEEEELGKNALGKLAINDKKYPKNAIRN